MYKYRKTKKLLENIAVIERLYGQLESQVVSKELLLNLERNNLIKSSFASNSIEGNPLSQMEVSNLILGDRVPANRNEKEVRNYFDILKSIGSDYTSFDFDTILLMHKKLLGGIDDDIAGMIRNRKVVVGNPAGDGQIIIKHNPPKHTEGGIKKLMFDLIDWTHDSGELPVITAGIYHHQFVYIHPFVDGNGRTCRLSTTLLLHNFGYFINKYFILDDYYDIDRLGYSDALHSADSGDETLWLEYFTDGMKYSLQSALSKVDSGMNGLSFSSRPTDREKDALRVVNEFREVTSSDIVKELNISRQQAFNLLSSLVEKGYLNKGGNTKNSYYFMK